MNIPKTDSMESQMTVQDLISTLENVKNKDQVIAVSIDGFGTLETLVVGVSPESADKHDDPEEVGVCWLKIPKYSTVHSEE